MSTRNPMRKDLKLAFYISSGDFSGGANTAELSYYEQFIKALSEHDKYIVISDKKITQDKFTQLRGTKFIYFKRNKLDKILDIIFLSILGKKLLKNFKIYYYTKFEKILTKEHIEFVVSLGINPLVNNLKKTPYVTFIWDIGHLQFPNFLEISGYDRLVFRDQLWSEHLKKARFVFVESEQGKKNVQFYYHKSDSQIRVTPLVPPNVDSSAKECRIREEIPFALYPAQFWPHKNHEVLIYALKKLKDADIKRKKIIFTGKDQGSKFHIESLVKRFRLDGEVEFKGFVSDKELAHLYQQADIMLFPSLLGPTNFPPLQALSFGTPVAASQSEWFLKDLKNNIIHVDPFNVSAWANLLKANFKPKRKNLTEIQKVYKKIEESNIKIFTAVTDIISIELSLNLEYNQ